MSNTNFPRFPGGATSSSPGSLNAAAAPFVPRTPSSVPRMVAGAGLAGSMFGSGAAAGTGATMRLATTVHGGATSVLAGPTAPASSVSAATSALATTGASLGDTRGISGHLGQEEDFSSVVFVPSSRDPVYIPFSRDINLLPIGQFPQDYIKSGSA